MNADAVEKGMEMWLLAIAFVVGALTVVGAQAAIAFVLLRWLKRRVANEVARSKIPTTALSSPAKIDPYSYDMQGFVWVLDAENIPLDKALRQQKGKKEILEVTPIKKFAKVKDDLLLLAESDGSLTEIKLNGCTVAAVSATDMSSRKWAKRYPIKVESNSSILYKGGKVIYIYLETSLEKESWCKALYLASCEGTEKLKWVSKLNTEFQNYLLSLNAVYPSFMKPFSHTSFEHMDKSIKLDASSSKVRNFFRKLSKKSSKSGLENKPSCVSTSSREASIEKSADCSAEEITAPSLSSSATRNYVPVSSDTDSDDRASNEGTPCWNLLLSRLFFDAKQNEKMRTSMQARIQRTLSNMRTPSYIGEVVCTTVDLGNLPPYIHAMKVLPTNMNEVSMMEIDIEYSGGAIFEIETRVKVQELELQEDGPNLESSSMDEVKADMLEGIERFSENLKYSEETKDLDVREDAIKNPRNMTGAAPYSKWKSIKNSIAKQVSQVPLTLGIRVASVRGKIRLFIKAPPSDQIWFGFKSMPDLDFQLEPFIGDHKIGSGNLVLFLISRFKAAVRETLVLPNCECACLSWMLAEKDDWVPCKSAPFMWINQEQDVSTTRQEQPRPPPRPSTEKRDEATLDTASSYSEETSRETETTESANDTSNVESTVKELQAPLLGSEEQVQRERKSTEDSEYCTRSRQSELAEDEDSTKHRKLLGARAKMLGLSKKMSEKIVEKRRHYEEKGRNIVERMKGQQQ